MVLGGIAPIDPNFVGLVMGRHGLEAVLDVVAIHGFPFDWHLWQVEEWPARVAEIKAVTGRPIWATEVGVSSFGCEEVQALGLRKTVQLLPPWSTRSSGTPSSTCARTARRRRATRRPRAPPTTATSTSACSPRAGRRSWPCATSRPTGDLPVAAPARPGAGAGHRYLAKAPGGAGGAHRRLLGGLARSRRGGVLRLRDARAGPLRGDPDPLLHPPQSGHPPPPHQPPRRSGGVRLLLRRGGAPLPQPLQAGRCQGSRRRR